MKLFRNISIFAFVAACAALGSVACSDDDGIDNREHDYGYVQFKLYKEGSQPALQSLQSETRADGNNEEIVDQLDMLAQAAKLQVTLKFGNTEIAQTLTLSAANSASAEFGLRSEKLQLLSGDYQIISFKLYNINDIAIYNGTTSNRDLAIVPGGLTVHDLTANVTPRGTVRFHLTKDFDGFKDWKEENGTNAGTRTVEKVREYTFDEIAYFDVTIHKVGSDDPNDTHSYTYLPATFSIHFDEDDEESDEFGYQTSSIVCDSLLSLPAGTYEITDYAVFDSGKYLLERHEEEEFPDSNFTVVDNETADAKIPVSLHEADAYMQDNYALRAIWEALDGKNWYYGGQDYNKGCNWDFNKSPDLWSDQPGIEVHSNGRVAKLVLSEFGIKGEMPAAIGQLTELVELYLGTHNDTNTGTYDPMLDQSKSLADRNRNRMEYNKQYLAATHIQSQMSYPCALALKEHNLSSPAMYLYEQGYSEQQIFDKSGKQLEIQPKDVIAGRFCNGLTKLPKEIGNLTKLEYLYIGNSPIEELPSTIENLTSCTLLEIYNCPRLKGLPPQVANMPALVQVNISCNKGTAAEPGWDKDAIRNAVKYFATGKSKETIQMLYVRDNNLEEFPEEVKDMGHLGLLDLASNKISGEIPFLGENFMPSELYLEHNQITGFTTQPVKGRNLCFNTDNLETIDASYNRLTKVPDIFTSNTPYYVSSANFAYNQIEEFENAHNGYQGINVTTFTLSGNRIKNYPSCLVESNSQISYILLAGNGMTGFEENCFTCAEDDHQANLISMDLTYNNLTKFPDDFHAGNLPYLYGVDLSYNSFTEVPFGPIDASSLTVYAIRGQRDANGARCLKTWPTGIYKHTGLRGLFLGSNDLRKIDDTISSLIYTLDISDNPNITFDASDICYYWKAGAYNLTYDKTQNIINCPEMLE